MTLLQQFKPFEGDQEGTNDGNGQMRRRANHSHRVIQMIDKERIDGRVDKAHDIAEQVYDEKDFGSRHAIGPAEMQKHFVAVDGEAGQGEGSHDDAASNDGIHGPQYEQWIRVVIAHNDWHDAARRRQYLVAQAPKVDRYFDGRHSNIRNVHSKITRGTHKSGNARVRGKHDHTGVAIAQCPSIVEHLANGLFDKFSIDGQRHDERFSSVISIPKRAVRCEWRPSLDAKTRQQRTVQVQPVHVRGKRIVEREWKLERIAQAVKQ